MATGASDGFDFPRRPDGTLLELWQAILRLLPQLTRKTLRACTVYQVETPIAHGEKSAPKGCNVLPLSDARVWQTQNPDEHYFYLAASANILVNIEVIR